MDSGTEEVCLLKKGRPVRIEEIIPPRSSFDFVIVLVSVSLCLDVDASDLSSVTVTTSVTSDTAGLVVIVTPALFVTVFSATEVSSDVLVLVWASS